MSTAIKVDRLTKAYGGVPALKDLSFSVEKGTAFGLLGANGAGKSTAIECILGTKTADSGSAEILEKSPFAHRKELFARVGVQFQEENYQDGIRVDELCEEMACVYRKPASYHMLLEKFGLAGKERALVKELSGGQRQRLFIVLALLPNPEVVFLDELTTGLDVRVRRDVWHRLETLKKQGITIVLTSHFMDEVEALCDRICILKKGSCVFLGTVAEAIARSPYEKFEDAYLWFTDEEDRNDESL